MLLSAFKNIKIKIDIKNIKKLGNEKHKLRKMFIFLNKYLLAGEKSFFSGTQSNVYTLWGPGHSDPLHAFRTLVKSSLSWLLCDSLCLCDSLVLVLCLARRA